MIAHEIIIEHSAIVLLARILDADAAVVVAGDIASISVSVFDTETEELIDTVTAIPADVITALSTTGWSVDATGYNFRLPLSGDPFDHGGPFQVEAKFVPIAGDSYYAVWRLQAEEIYSEGAGS